MAREAKQEYRYHEDGAIALYRRPNSAMWYARCKLDDGVAPGPFSTGTDDEREAVKIAKKRMLYAEVDRDRGIEPGDKAFALIAVQWLKRKRVEVEKGISTKIKVDAYETIVRRVHILYFGKTKITEITPRKLPPPTRSGARPIGPPAPVPAPATGLSPAPQDNSGRQGRPASSQGGQ